MGGTSFINCTFFTNTTANTTPLNGVGGAIRASHATGSILTITNCVFWGNADSWSADNISLDSAASVVNMGFTSINTNAGSCTFSGTKKFGLGITNVNPQFASAEAPYDVHLKSTGGRWDPGLGTWVTDAVSSPCIDAGDASDYSLEPLPNGGIINLGRYGNTLYASKAPASSSPKGTGMLIVVR